MRGLVAPEKTSEKSIPDEVFDAAKKYLEDNHLIRYITKKYNMPPTDPRVQAYTLEDIIIEYVADAIEDDRIQLGKGGRPVKKVIHKGVEIFETGNAMFDAMEREWAEQDISDEGKEPPPKPLPQFEVEDGSDDLFELIKEKFKDA